MSDHPPVPSSTPSGTPAALHRSWHRGFTLLEMIVVIVVIGVLALLAIPTFSAVVQRAEVSNVETAQAAVAREVVAILAFGDGTTPSEALAEALADVPVASSVGVSASSYSLLPESTALTPAPASARGEVSWATAPDYIAWLTPAAGDVNVGCRVELAAATSGCWQTPAIDAVVALEGPGAAPTAPTTTTQPPVQVTEGPSTPGNLVAAPADAQVELSWEAVQPSQSAPVDGYRVYVNGDGSPVYEGTATSFTVTGLENAASYSFAVTAFGAGGESDPATATATPNIAPGAVDYVNAVPGSGELSVNWAPAAHASEYVVTVDGTEVHALAATSYTITGLTNGTSYTVGVAGRNSVGTGPSATDTATPYAPLAAPTLTSAAAGDRRATVTWTAASGGTWPVANYQVWYQSDSSAPAYVTTSNLSTVITGLAHSTDYEFRVVAFDTNGNESAMSNVGSARPWRSSLALGETFGQGGAIRSPNGAHTFSLQTDGNLVRRVNGSAVWSTSTFNSTNGVGTVFTFQTDRHLVLRGPRNGQSNQILWTSGNFQAGTPASEFRITDTGVIQVRRLSDGHIYWSQG